MLLTLGFLEATANKKTSHMTFIKKTQFIACSQLAKNNDLTLEGNMHAHM